MKELSAQEMITGLREAMVPKSRTPKENKTLCEKYPFLRWYGDPLYMEYSEDHELDYHYTWEDELPSGWRKAFCPHMWDELKAILEKADYVDKFRFTQIKEKYGSLRLYYSDVPEEIYNEIEAWEQKYNSLSEKVCIDCGAPATYMSTGWISFLCTDCAKERARTQVKQFGEAAHFVKMEDIEEFFNDQEQYWDKHQSDDIFQ